MAEHRPAHADPDARDQNVNSSENFPDPLAHVGGLAPARSALTLRAVLASFGLIVNVAATIVSYAADAPVWMVAAFVVLASVAVVDLFVIARRKRRGEPG